jgi:hypothetical protein
MTTRIACPSCGGDGLSRLGRWRAETACLADEVRPFTDRGLTAPVVLQVALELAYTHQPTPAPLLACLTCRRSCDEHCPDCGGTGYRRDCRPVSDPHLQGDTR